MMKSLPKFFSFAALSLFCVPALAAPDTTAKYESIDAVPPVFAQAIGRTQYIEEYVLHNLTLIRRFAKDHKALTPAEIEQNKKRQELEQRYQQLSNMIRYDINFDTKITKDEIKEFFEGRNAEREGLGRDYARQIDEIMKLDTDNDGFVSYAEMSTLRAETAIRGRHRAENNLEEYMALDPNKDGFFTLKEMEILSRKAFATFDIDNDGFLSEQEMAFYRRAQSDQVQLDPACKMPPVPPEEKLILLGMYEGQYMPTVTAAGQYEESSAAKINIEKTEKPLYVVLASYDPMIFDIADKTDKIGHVVVSSLRGGSGVVGVAKEKITFMPPNCLQYFYDAQKSERGGENRNAEKTARVVKKLAGRAPDVQKGAYAVNQIVLDADKITFETANRDQPPALPKGYDAMLWQEAVRFTPAGLIDVDPTKVVSVQKAEKYTVLPNQMGIAKLAAEGFIEPVYTGGKEPTILAMRNGELKPVNPKGVRMASAFKIVKPLPAFPAGMGGAHSVTFVLPENMPMPPGDPVHSCVIKEKEYDAQRFYGGDCPRN